MRTISEATAGCHVNASGCYICVGSRDGGRIGVC